MKNLQSAALFVEQGLGHFPEDQQMLTNLVSIYSSLKNHKKSVDIAKKIMTMDSNNSDIYNPLCSSLHKLGDFKGAAHYDTQSSVQKDNAYCANPKLNVTLDLSKALYDLTIKKRLIAYSLWGNNPRYINGPYEI
jgi:Tfp pilus assembly protein PilF